jgi:hypothetical protein
MFMLTFTLDDPAMGQLSWTPSQRTQDAWMTLPPNEQEAAREKVLRSLEGYMLMLQGCILAKEDSLLMLDVMNSMMSKAAGLLANALSAEIALRPNPN